MSIMRDEAWTLSLFGEPLAAPGVVRVGGPDDDIIGGTTDDDSLFGSAGNDILSSGNGDDILSGGAGSDNLQGGNGNDLALFNGPLSEFVVGPANGTGFEYAVHQLGSRDLLAEIERVSLDGGLTSISVAQFEQAAFKPYQYLASYPDLRAVFGLNATAATQHYFANGRLEGRDPGRFDSWLYTASNPDLARAFGLDSEAAARHYINNGMAEGRAVSTFNPLHYIASNPDLIRAFSNNPEQAVRHYLTAGAKEGRVTDSFSAFEYGASNRDLLINLRTYGQASDYVDRILTTQYLHNGFSEGRPTTTFDPARYIAGSGDLIRAFGDNLSLGAEHYVRYGYLEPRPLFDGVGYLLSNPDLTGSLRVRRRCSGYAPASSKAAPLLCSAPIRAAMTSSSTPRPHTRVITSLTGGILH